MLLNCGVGEDSWEYLGQQEDQTSPSWRKSVVNIHWKDWCWSWNSNILGTWCEWLTHLKRPWCWERLKVGGEGDDRGWVFLPGESQGRGSLVGCRLWGRKVLDMTEWLNWTELILHSKAKLACYSRYLFTSYFCIPVPYDEKDIFFGLVPEGLIGFHSTFQLQLLQHY